MDMLENYIFLLQNQLIQQLIAYGDLRNVEKNKRAMEILVDFFLDLQREFASDCFLEIGAFDASFCKLAGAKYKSGQFVACEANPFNISKFSSQIASHNPPINYIHTAVTDYDGNITLYVSEEFNGKTVDKANAAGSLFKSTKGNNSISIEVPATTINSLADKYNFRNKRICMWIDAEGSQLNVLRGASDILPYVTSLYIEIDSDYNFESGSPEFKIYRFLLEHNFMPVLRDYYWGGQYNLIAIRNDLVKKIMGQLSRYTIRCVSLFNAIDEKMANHCHVF